MATANSIQKLFESLLLRRQQEEEKAVSPPLPYLILLQHSQAFELRRRQQRDDDDDGDDDAAVYHSAGLRTPSENAARDWQAGALWLDFIETTVLNHDVVKGGKKKDDGDDAAAPSCTILRIQTLPSTATKRRAQQQQQQQENRIRVIDCCSQDPFGWDDDDDDGTSCTQETTKVNLNRLESILSAVQKNLCPNTVVVFVDSITPIVMRHGITKTICFLQRLMQQLSTSAMGCRRVMVVPVLIESLSTKQHIALEDGIANAVLNLTGGEAVMLRQGVREKGNMVREGLPYRIIRTSGGGGGGDTPQAIKQPVIEILSANDADSLSKDVDAKAFASLSMASSDNITSAKHGKIKLQVNEGRRDTAITATSPVVAERPPQPQQPRIFLQDDDPEFEDYDEEDPDDDLEL